MRHGQKKPAQVEAEEKSNYCFQSLYIVTLATNPLGILPNAKVIILLKSRGNIYS
jgi:hypothetical protein